MRTIYVWIAVLAFGVTLLGASSVYASMQGDVDQAATIIERFQAVPEEAIPQAGRTQRCQRLGHHDGD